MVPSVVVAAVNAATEVAIVAAAEVVAAAAAVACFADGRGAETGDDGDGGAGRGVRVAARAFACCRRRERGGLPVEVAVRETHRHPSVGCIAAVYCTPGGVVGLLHV